VGGLTLELEFTNQTQGPVQNFAIQLNKSSFGLTVKAPAMALPAPVLPGQTSAPFKVAMACTPAMMAPAGSEPNALVQVALKNMHSGGVFYFAIPVPLFALLKPSPLDPDAFKAKWQGTDKAGESSATVQGIPGGGDVGATRAHCKGRLEGAVGAPCEAVSVAGPDGVTRAYYHALTLTNVLVLAELAFKPGFPGCKLTVRSDRGAPYAALFRASLEQLLNL